MQYYSQKELDDALRLIASTISKCEKMKFKFAACLSALFLCCETVTL